MKKVLIVDDAAFMRFAIRQILEKHDFEVAGEAEDGFDAINKYKNLKPDVVTMDITMPGLSGLESLKKIIAFDPDAKIIMVSAMGQENMVMDAIMSGAKSFIIKPFKEDHVIQTLNKV